MQPRYRIPNSNGASTSAPTFWNLLNQNGEEDVFSSYNQHNFFLSPTTLISVILYYNYSQLERILLAHFLQNIALWNKSNGSYDIKEFGTLPLIFSTSKYFRWKFQPWPSFFPHANIPDTWKRGQLSLEQMKKMEKVKVKSHLRYLAACSVQKKRWDIWRIFFSDFRSVFSP